jgi:hypothetical protein
MTEYEKTEQAYKNGYAKGFEDGKPKWIPVTERLPDNDYGKHWKERPHYLVCLANGTMRVVTFGFKEYGWWIDSHNCVLSKEHYTEVTHWMPLPDAPKEG